MAKLLSCPFCGAEAHSRFNEVEAGIWCTSCEYRMVFSTCLVSYRKSADYQRRVLIERWNTRAALSPEPAQGGDRELQ